MRPPPSTIAVATAGGVANAGTVLALYSRAGYPTLESAAGVGLLAVTGFVLGFVALLVATHTRLLTPAAGFLAGLVGVTYLELASPMPEWGELNGHAIVDGPTHVASYANAWDLWLALLLFAGVVEFGIRCGYRIGDRRLRNLPQLPLSRYAVGWIVTGFAGYVGAATMLLVLRSGIRPPVAAAVVFVVAAAVAAVPLAALLARGILLPIALFATVVPYVLGVEVFTTTDSPVHILLFGPYAIVLAVVWAIEEVSRSRLREWDGGRFTGANRAS